MNKCEGCVDKGQVEKRRADFETFKKQVVKIICGQPLTEDNSDERVPSITNIEEYDHVLISTPTNYREEAIVEDVAESSVKLVRMSTSPSVQIIPQWFAKGAVVDNLGPADDDTLKKFGFEVPDPPAVPDVKTGAYVLLLDGQHLMVEVDRVGTQYIFRFVGESLTYKIQEAAGLVFMPFSDPDVGTMLVEPGIYYVEKAERTIEVIPFNGHAWYRYIDKARLYQLDPRQVPDIQQWVEPLAQNPSSARL